MTKYYKFLTEDNTGEYSGFDFVEYLPKGEKPGKWLPMIEELNECEAGYHFCDKNNISEWCNTQLFEVEYKGMIIKGEGKYLAQQIRFVKKIDRWNDKNARLAACDIAEQIAMVVWNKYYQSDKRPQNAIDIARLFANGKATKEELDAACAAAWDAAWDAACAAARDAAWAAARAAARDAAWAAARDAARDAACAAAWDAAWAAARAAARDATWAAASKIICKYAGIS